MKLRTLIEPYLRDSPLNLGLAQFWSESRWQWLPSSEVWLKREDELGFPGTGPKQRKLLSLVADIQKQGRVVTTGSSRSTFLLSLASLCRGLRIPLEMHLIRATPWLDQGVDGFYKSLLGTGIVHWVERDAYMERLSALQSDPAFIPEGGSARGSLPGALSLAVEILEQSDRLNRELDEIWIDAGSGFTAQALILGLGFMKWPGTVHVILCAGDDETFQSGLNERQNEAKAIWPDQSFFPCVFRTAKPSTARSYGSTNRAVWDQVNQTLQSEGVLLDPLYNAKLHLTYAALRKGDGKRTLLVHSGGALTTFAYPEAFSPFRNLK